MQYRFDFLSFDHRHPASLLSAFQVAGFLLPPRRAFANLQRGITLGW